VGFHLRGLIASVCVVAALPACGNSGSSNPTSGKPASMTAAQYRQRANAICASLYRSRPPKTTPIATLKWGVRRAGRALADLKALRPPTSLANLHERVVAVDTRVVNRLSSVVKRVKAGHLTVIEGAQAFEHSSVGTGETALWKKLGVKVCAESPAQYLSHHSG
jgi:hypothetical protein